MHIPTACGKNVKLLISKAFIMKNYGAKTPDK